VVVIEVGWGRENGLLAADAVLAGPEVVLAEPVPPGVDALVTLLATTSADFS
jgi:hypothetical protein